IHKLEDVHSLKDSFHHNPEATSQATTLIRCKSAIPLAYISVDDAFTYTANSIFTIPIFLRCVFFTIRGHGVMPAFIPHSRHADATPE
ncbi:MAG: hypothetical protein ACRCR6_01745, partial [Plesiomonas sp.]